MMVSTKADRGGENNWINIQISTFTQWVNQNLQKVDKEIASLDQDMIDGVCLVALIEVLQSRRLGRVIKRPLNDFQRVENVNMALNALRDDGIKLVNIGSEDIIRGSQKLILGLMWQLILKYQIGGGSRSATMHPKARMMEWLNSALPDQHVSNFTTDWNDGKALLALLEYCRPGITDDDDSGVPGSDSGLENCRRGLDIAEKKLNVPAILTPEALNSPQLDELSSMTYLSYFMNKDSPGYESTLDWINKRLPPEKKAKDFTDSFHDGNLLCDLVTALGCHIPGWPDPLSQSNPTDRINKAIAAANLEFGIECPFTPRDLTAGTDSDHLKVMAYCSRLRNAVGDDFMPEVVEEIEITKPATSLEMAPSFSNEPIEGLLMASSENTMLDIDGMSVYKVGQPISTLLQLDESIDDPNDVEIMVEGPNEMIVPLEGLPSWADDRCSASFVFVPVAPGWHQARATGGRVNVAPLRYDVTRPPGSVRVVLPPAWPDGVETHEEQDVTLEISEVDPSAVTAEWTDSAGHRNRLDIEKDPVTGRHQVRATPDRPGTWELFVTCEGRPVPGSPFPLEVREAAAVLAASPTKSRSRHSSSASSASSRRSDAYNLDQADSGVVENGVDRPERVAVWATEPVTCGRDCWINVRLGEEPGEISALITKDGMLVPCDILPREDEVQQICFRPDEPGCYKLTVYHGGEEIGAESFNVEREVDATTVRCTGTGLKVVPIDKETTFDIHADGIGDTSRLLVKITAPSGSFVSTSVRESQENVSVDYTPREVGRHQLEVHLDGQHVFGSPFEVDVFDPAAVEVHYESSIVVDEITHFRVDLTRAGCAPLDCSVLSPSGVDIQLSRPSFHPANAADRCPSYSYTPSEPGPYRLIVHFGECELRASPYLQHADRRGGSGLDADDLPAPPAMLPHAYGEGLTRGEINWSAVFFVDPKDQKGELFVQVDGPNTVAKCNIEPEASTGKYRVSYTPTVVGQYTIAVEWNQQPLPDSPFHPLIVAPGSLRCPDLRPGSVRPLDPLVVGRKKELVFNTEGGGPGTMRAEVRGPGGAPLSVRVKERTSSQVAVKFKPMHPGPHRLSVFWGEIQLPGVPFEGEAINEQPLDHSKAILSGRGLKEARVNEESEFIIDGKHAGPGKPMVLMKGVRKDIEVEIESILEHRYRCSYVPTVAGAYLLTIWWSERQLRGSPFKVTVVAPSDASKVVCSGDGLSHGVMGEEMECQIDTRRAGPGELTAHCSGTHKVAYCELYDHRDGTYSLKIKPQEVGRHVLQVKFGGEHVHGSPFISRVSSAPDASCVRVVGPGVQHGLISTFQSRFLVETRGAGAGQLTVRVRGPRGAFRVEMERETRKDRTILCRYDPTESGEYWINVTWSGHHVPGSPFRVMLFDTREQLRAFARQSGVMLDEDRGQWREQL